MKEPLMERSTPYLEEDINFYYVCPNGHGQYVSGEYEMEDDGPHIVFIPFYGQDICKICGERMERWEDSCK